jgi:hypothetical protein
MYVSRIVLRQHLLDVVKFEEGGQARRRKPASLATKRTRQLLMQHAAPLACWEGGDHEEERVWRQLL